MSADFEVDAQKSQSNEMNQNLPYFNSYLTDQEIGAYLQSGVIIQGSLRINPKNYEEAYINAPDGSMDVYIGGVFDRNAALHGDLVGISLLPSVKWRVLHESLNSFLEQNPHLKTLVRSTTNEHSNAETPQNNHIMSIKPSTSHVNVKDNANDIENPVVEPPVPQQSQIADNQEVDSSKKKRKGRGKKNKKKKEESKEGIDKDNDENAKVEVFEENNIGKVEIIECNDPLLNSSSEALGEDTQAESTVCNLSQSVANLSIQAEESTIAPIPDKELLDSSQNLEPYLDDERPEGVIIVPPDELSECEDYTDDDSGSSQIFDEDDIVDKRFLPKFDKIIIRRPKVKAESTKAQPENPLPSPDKEIMIKRDEVHLPNEPGNPLPSPSNEPGNPLPSPSNDPGNPLPSPSNDKETPAIVPSASKPKTAIEAVNYHHKILVNLMEWELSKTREAEKVLKTESKDGLVPIIKKEVNSNSSSNEQPKSIPVPPPPQRNKSNALNKDNSFKKNPKNIPEINPLDVMKFVPEWEKYVQRRGVVVYIFEKNHTRMAAGFLKPFGKVNNSFALFSPTDGRIPRMRIPIAECPRDFLRVHKDHSKTIFLAKIVEWRLPGFALGQLVKAIGNAGDLEVEMEALLLEHGIDDQPFPEEIISSLPQIPWTIPQEEIATRVDLRSSCIFSIDPDSARDLDDAVSCLKLPSGNLRIGVHIADVSYFLQAGTELDKLASSRGTTVYLPDKVIPMLPAPLCEQLCSLNPNEDRLTVSVIWEVTPSGDIIGEWFGKTIIRSCAKLSYDHAQAMIENELKDLQEKNFPDIANGFKLKHIYDVVKALQKLAVIFRTKRLNDGALRLDQVKINFNIDPITKDPNGIFIFEHKDSNKLIEEFMLLANIFVARRIYKCFPTLAVLRQHPNPHKVPLRNTLAFLSQHGIYLDGSSAGALNQSICKYKGNDAFSIARMQLIVNMCSKPMQYARYLCSGYIKDPIQFHHYALNVPLYTHFTSPIRRYADIMVHRLLATTFDPVRYATPLMSPKDVQRICENCNKQKQASKVAQETSTELFLGEFVRKAGEMIENGMIIGVLDKSVDVYLLRLGIIKRCYVEKLSGLKGFLNDSPSKTIYLEWSADNARGLAPLTQALTFFKMVQVQLKPFDQNSLKFNALIIRPDL